MSATVSVKQTGFEFAHTFTPRRDMALRNTISSAPVPVAQNPTGSIDHQSNLRIG